MAESPRPPGSPSSAKNAGGSKQPEDSPLTIGAFDDNPLTTSPMPAPPAPAVPAAPAAAPIRAPASPPPTHSDDVKTMPLAAGADADATRMTNLNVRPQTLPVLAPVRPPPATHSDDVKTMPLAAGPAADATRMTNLNVHPQTLPAQAAVRPPPPTHSDDVKTMPLAAGPAADATRMTTVAAPAPAPPRAPTPDPNQTMALAAGPADDATRMTMGAPPAPAPARATSTPAPHAPDPGQTQAFSAGPADDATRMTMGGPEARTGAAGATQAAPSRQTQATLDPDATRVITAQQTASQPDAATQITARARPEVGMGDDQATLVAAKTPPTRGSAGSATVATNDANTVPFGASAPGASAAGRGTGAPAVSGTFARTSVTQRVSRTKLNQSLPAATQMLDARLQVSRPSVLADLVSSRGAEQLPKGVRKLMEEQGTEGRYAINRELAHGGMGAVLDISDHDFRRKAAMKVILSQFANSHEMMERFLAEAQVTAQLEHPNIVPVHDLGVMEDGTLYFTMKMIEGQSLGKVIKLLQQDRGLLKLKDGTVVPPDAESAAAAAQWTEQEKLHVFLKVLDGVGFANARGVIHRDIKPDNIMLGPHGEVLVVDWGIAKVTGVPERKPAPGMVPAAATTGVISIRTEEAASATMAGSAMGTLYYMPPEQAQGQLELVDARSDVYALGATLYEFLSLKRTMKPGMSIPEMMATIIEGRWIPLDEADPTINPDLVSIIHHAMSRETSGRYPSCEAFSEDLRRYLAGVAVEARKRTSREIVAMWVAQNRKKIYASVAGIVLVIVAIYGTIGYLHVQDVREAHGLYEQAAAAWAQVPENQGTMDQLAPISTTLATANHEDPKADDIIQLMGKVSGAIAVAKGREQAVARKKDLQQQSDARVAEAKKLDAQNDEPSLVAALAAWKEAQHLTSSSEIESAITTDTIRLRDRTKLRILQALGTHKINAADWLAQAEGLPKDSPDLDGLITKISGELTLADADPINKLDGMDALATRLQILKGEHNRALEARDNLKQGRDFAALAANSLAGKDYTLALAQAEKAMGFAPKDPDIVAEYRTISDAKGKADAIAEAKKQRDDAEAGAKPLVAKALDALQEMMRQEGLRIASAAEVEKLTRSLAASPLEDKKTLFLARQAEQAARTDKLAAWLGAEQSAEQAAVLLEPWSGNTPPPEQYVHAEDVLAALYHQRLHEARDSHDTDEAAVMSSLLYRADRFSHTYAADFANSGMVTVHGRQDGGLVKARRLVPSLDGRMAPVGQSVDVALERAQAFAAGTWQFTSGDVIIATVVNPDRPLDIRLPQGGPRIPGLSLRYVPADLHVDSQGRPAGMKPFWLGTTEVTYEQYLAFLKDPKIFAGIRKGVIYAHKNKDNDDVTHGQAPLSIVELLPVTANGSPLYHLINPDDEKGPSGIDPVDDAVMSLPITMVKRSYAEGYCQWLSRVTGLQVRLPTRAERLFAATGDDPQRVYPWGPLFDGNFCNCSAVKQQKGPANVSDPSLDVGPFGHYGLGGGVREWLMTNPTQDDPRAGGTYRGEIAAGGWADDSPLNFRSDYVENLDPDARNPEIGFRILVETP